MNIEVCSADHFFETCDCDLSRIVYQVNSTDSAVYARMKEQVKADHNKSCHQAKKYVFDGFKIGAAHSACQNKFMNLLASEDSMYIFVDNTNTTLKELSYYVNACKSNNIDYTIVNVRCDAETAAKRNSHGVPEEKVLQMAKRIKDNDKLIPVDWPQQEYYNGGK